MIYIFIFCLALLILFIFVRNNKIKNLNTNFQAFLVDFNKFNILLNQNIGDKYITKSYKNHLLNISNELLNKIDTFINNKKYFSKNNIQLIDDIYLKLDNTNNLLELFREKYFNNQEKLFGKELDKVEKYPLDILQKQSIYIDEKNLLVIAGAGAGKTSTIIGKVRYLLLNGYKPEEILLISYTNASALELKERIKDKINQEMDVMTFHKLGLDILEEKLKTKIKVIEDNEMEDYRKTLYSYLIDDLCKNNTELFLEFFNYLTEYDKFSFDFESMGDYENYRRSKGYGTIRGKLSNSSIYGEFLKSSEEVEIANFLTLNSINYEYEKEYEFDTSNEEFKQYKPDFYLTDYGIYIEHFGIDKNGNVPKFFGDGLGGYEIANEKYKNGIQWKINIHKKNNTKLIQTYSYEKIDGVLLKNLKKNLLKHGVVFEQIDSEKLKDIINTTIKSDYNVFILQVLSFLSLFRSNNNTIQEIKDLIPKIYNTKYKINKATTFIKIFELVLKHYLDFLKEKNLIDFDDMIHPSTQYIKQGFKLPYKYVIVDEFQDISLGRFKFLQTILKYSNSKLFCVGDDRQSIYRFNGGDVNIFTNFSKYFQDSDTCFINKTYRYPQIVNDITYKFITKNPKQIKKKLESGNKSNDKDVYEIIGYNDTTEIPTIIKNLKIKYKGNFIFLGRNNYEEDYLGIYKKNFLSIHRSKGLESDYIVLLSGNGGKGGFPSEITDSFIMNLVLSNIDNFEYSEERRLMYVALTRAKIKTFILYKYDKKSSFVSELESILGLDNNEKLSQKNICPRCKKGYLLDNPNYKRGALKCSNYPKCDISILTISPLKRHKGLPFSKIDDSYLDWFLKTFPNDNEILFSVYYEKEKRKNS